MNHKIVSVEAVALAATWDKVFGGWDRVPRSLLNPAANQIVLPRRGQFATLVRVRTEDGLEGVGEAYGLPQPEVTATLIGGLLGRMIIGQDAMASELIWDRLFASQKGAGHTGGFYLEAISGIDQALWDLRGKALGQPLHRLLGGPVRERVYCYASPVMMLATPEESAAKAAEYVAAGHRAIKLKLGRGLATDVAHARAVREAVGPDVELLTDLNCAYGVAEAVKVAGELEQLGFSWFEEPLDVDDLEGLAEVRARIKLPVVAGECWFNRYQFKQALLRRSVDTVMPNPARAGGITECLKIAHLCEAFWVDVSWHGVGTGINVAAALQLAAAVPNFRIYERNQLLNPLREGIVASKLEFADGHLLVPSGPGLGVEIDEGGVRQFEVLRVTAREAL
jgi:L-alanine-DL-glutamate epimerase-like enolase superfamily enzyme